MRNLVLFLVVLAIAPINALAQAATFSTIWGWYASPQFGPGPSYAGWYGLSLIFGLAVGCALSGYNVTSEDSKGLKGALMKLVGLLISYPLVLGFAWLVGSILGWL